MLFAMVFGGDGCALGERASWGLAHANLKPQGNKTGQVERERTRLTTELNMAVCLCNCALFMMDISGFNNESRRQNVTEVLYITNKLGKVLELLSAVMITAWPYGGSSSIAERSRVANCQIAPVPGSML